MDSQSPRYDFDASAAAHDASVTPIFLAPAHLPPLTHQPTQTLTTMKKSLFTLALAAASFCAAAQTTTSATAKAAATGLPTAAPAGYAELLGATITGIMRTGDPAELKALAAKMERAATVAPADWLPRYYQAYALVINVFQSKEAGDVKDKALDQAEAALTQARQLHGDESELLTLQAFLYQARLGINPQQRAQAYAVKVMETVAQAQALNPANPRPYLVEANNIYYTPEMFGGGPAAAKPLYEAAKAKFAAFHAMSPLAPGWGETQLQGRLKQYEATAAATPAPAK
ncbi:MAG: hypothetical protein ACRYFX_07860 [Janthinobacterium lividum]